MTADITNVVTVHKTDDWKSNQSGDFNNRTNWTQGIVPNSSKRAFIQVPGAYTITSDQDNSIRSLDFTAGPASLDITAGTFSIVGDKNSSLSGTINVGDGTTLSLTGRMGDNGTIALASTGDATTLAISGDVVFTEDEGAITLSGSGAQIVSDGAAAQLINGVAISGEGTIGDASLKLINRGGIYANSSGLLTIDTVDSVVNTETIEASGTGGLSIMNALVNNGALIADKSSITIGGVLSGTGHTLIEDGSVEVAKHVADTQQIRFDGNGKLILDAAQTFAGTVAFIDSTDSIDLANFAFGNGPQIANVTDTTVNGVAAVAVTITDRSLSVTINLMNQSGAYSTDPGAYQLVSDNNTANGHHPGTLFQLAPPAAT